MRIRRAVAATLEGTIGPERLQRLKGVEARTRRQLINVLDVEGAHAGSADTAAGPDRATSRPEQGGGKDHASPVRARTAGGTGKPRKNGARATLTRQERIDALGELSLDDVVNQETNQGWVSSDPFADFPPGNVTRHHVLEGLHRVLQPRTYLEIGVKRGRSLSLSRARSIGVDPAYEITSPLHCDLRTFLDKSDDFFLRPDALAHFDGVPVDLAFIDGMHLAEFALRDFINVERHMAPTGVVLIDDVLPRNDLEAYRIRRTRAWSGDVYKVLDVLEEHRPDLTVIPLNTTPTGTVLVTGLDPTSTVLRDAYPSIEESLLVPDPQHVADRWKRRTTARDPEVVLDLDVWADLVALRDKDASRAELEPVWRRLQDLPPVSAARATSAATE